MLLLVQICRLDWLPTGKGFKLGLHRTTLRKISMRKTPLIVITLAIVLIACALLITGCGIQRNNLGTIESSQTTDRGIERNPNESDHISNPQKGTIKITGTIVYKNLEGGFFVIKGNDGRIYDPINLPEPLKKDGLKVKVNAKLREDLGSIHMVGDIIEIVSVSAE